jgi:hypothetical protein
MSHPTHHLFLSYSRRDNIPKRELQRLFRPGITDPNSRTGAAIGCHVVRQRIRSI